MHNEIHPGWTLLVLYIWSVCLLLLREIPSFKQPWSTNYTTAPVCHFLHFLIHTGFVHSNRMNLLWARNRLLIKSPSELKTTKLFALTLTLVLAFLRAPYLLWREGLWCGIWELLFRNGKNRGPYAFGLVIGTKKHYIRLFFSRFRASSTGWEKFRLQQAVPLSHFVKDSSNYLTK